MLTRLSGWIDDRLRLSRWSRTTLRKVFPDHWSFMLGEVALFSFVTLVLTGIFLTLFFDASSATTRYPGSYAPLRGVPMSGAYRSVVDLSFDVRAGLLMRQIHHWAALVFLAAIVAHLARVFFTGAFRRPREINWVVGVTMLILAIVNGFAGYSMVDDLLSGTGLRIAYSIVLSMPFIGNWAASLLFGGQFPGAQITSRLFVLHVMIVPALIIGLGLGPPRHRVASEAHPVPRAGTHGGERDGDPPVARLRGEVRPACSSAWPRCSPPSVRSCRSTPSGCTGRSTPPRCPPRRSPTGTWVGSRAHCDWPARGGSTSSGTRSPRCSGPAWCCPASPSCSCYAWPFIEARVTHDHDTHHLLDRPRDRPVRTAIGAAVLTFYIVLFVAGSQDIIAQKLDASIETVLWTLRILAIVLPLAVGLARVEDRAATCGPRASRW